MLFILQATEIIFIVVIELLLTLNASLLGILNPHLRQLTTGSVGGLLMALPK